MMLVPPLPTPHYHCHRSHKICLSIIGVDQHIQYPPMPPSPPPRTRCLPPTSNWPLLCCVCAGGSIATCFADVHMLDTHSLEWSQPVTAVVGSSRAGAGAGRKGKALKVTPRAGHSGAVLDGRWYIVGGGNNVVGA